jgi:hypothetical protein
MIFSINFGGDAFTVKDISSKTNKKLPRLFEVGTREGFPLKSRTI